MLNNEELIRLIELPKTIILKEPSRGFRDEGRDIRCDLHLEAAIGRYSSFEVFMRRHNKYIENFSIGLRYQTEDRSMGTITLVRYNGPHGEVSRQPDGHYAKITHPSPH